MDEQDTERNAALPAAPASDAAVPGAGQPPSPADETTVAGYPGVAPTPPAPGYGPFLQPGQYPGYPTNPTYPGHPTDPTYPGYYPTYPGVPSQPSTPLYGVPFPGYAPAATAAAPEATPSSLLARPFAVWTSAFLAVGAFVLVALVYSAAELAFGSDWAQGVTTAGYAALILAALAAILTGVRVALGRRALSAVALGLLLSVALAGSGLGGILLTNPLHHAQAQSLEANGMYEAAIHEYSLSGEMAPNAPDIARSYDEWGESFLAQGSYLQALMRFNVVTTQYSQSGAPVDRAYKGFFDTYAAWVKSSRTDVPFVNAIKYFQTYRGMAACDATCQSVARDAEALARYHYGVALTSQSDFTDAIQQLDAVQAQFPNSPYAAQAHAADAKAYLGLGQQQLNGATCTDAVPTYQTLATRFADTPEGQQAKAALAAPVAVTGNLIHFPTNPTPTAYLSKHANPGGFYFSDEYTSPVDPHTGAFTFSKVKQGNYNLSTVRPVSGGTEYVWWQGNNGNLYIVNVGPLCTVQLGTYSYT